MQEVTIVQGNQALRAYQVNGLLQGAEPIKSYILIDTGAIPASGHKIIDFSLIDYDLQIMTIWTLSESNPTRGGVTIQIVPANNINISLHEFELTGDCSCMLVPFLVLDSRYKLKIIPDSPVVNILIYALPVHRLNYLGVTNTPVS